MSTGYAVCWLSPKRGKPLHHPTNHRTSSSPLTSVRTSYGLRSCTRPVSRKGACITLGLARSACPVIGRLDCADVLGQKKKAIG